MLFSVFPRKNLTHGRYQTCDLPIKAPPINAGKKSIIVWNLINKTQHLFKGWSLTALPAAIRSSICFLKVSLSGLPISPPVVLFRLLSVYGVSAELKSLLVVQRVNLDSLFNGREAAAVTLAAEVSDTLRRPGQMRAVRPNTNMLHHPPDCAASCPQSPCP